MFKLQNEIKNIWSLADTPISKVKHYQNNSYVHKNKFEIMHLPCRFVRFRKKAAT